MPKQIPNSERESRFLAAGVEIRAAADDKPAKVFGYAAKFDAESENLGSADRQFREIIKPGAFDEVLNDDVRALFNHESSAILARSKGGEGSLKLGVDAVGLWYEFEAPDTQVGRDLVTSLERGDVDQSSFSFTVDREGQEWEETRSEDGGSLVKRTINKVSRLFDVSPVTYPAYPDATVALRSLEASLSPESRDDGTNKPSKEELAEVGDWACRFGVNPAQ
jgi:HK97 family phage prohead protease